MLINSNSNEDIIVKLQENDIFEVDTSLPEVIDIDLDSVELIDIKLGLIDEIRVSVNDDGSGPSFPEYEGPYSVTPRKVPQTLETKEKTTVNDITIEKIRYTETINSSGEMPNRGAAEGTITTKSQQFTIQNGYHDGSGKVAISSTEQSKIISSNIKAGVEILGVTGDYTGEGVTAQSKVATPYTDKDQTILPDADYDYLSQVTVEKIAYTETPNAAGGLTVTIGTVSPS